jgi:flagellar biogenesis protein FliO
MTSDATAFWNRIPRKVIGRTWGWFESVSRQAVSKQRRRRLSLRETLPLGEKRFLAVVQFEQERFLVGSTAQCISLVARLGAEEPAPDPSFRSGDR